MKKRHAVAMEQVHNGTCYMPRDEGTGRVVTRIPRPQGVRQSSVESPLLFVLLNDEELQELRNCGSTTENSGTPRSDVVRDWDDFRDTHRIALNILSQCMKIG